MRLRAQYFFFFFLPCLPLLLMLPFLAEVPLSPDAVELWTVAQQGGVAHPPGSPLWIMLLKTVTHLGFWWGSFLSWLCLLWSCYFFRSLFTSMGLTWPFSTTLLLLLVSFPAVWEQSTQIEKYAPLLLLCSGAQKFLWDLLRGISEDRDLRGVTLGLGICTGLAWSHHYASAALLPWMIFASYRVFKTSENKRYLMNLWIPALGIPGLAYASLLLWAYSAVWPNWGGLTDLSSLFSYLFILEHGYFNSQLQASAGGSESLSIFQLAVQQLLAAWHVFLLPLGLAFTRLRIKQLSPADYLLWLNLLFLAQMAFMVGKLQAPLAAESVFYFKRYLLLFVPSFLSVLAIGLRTGQQIMPGSRFARACFIDCRS